MSSIIKSHRISGEKVIEIGKQMTCILSVKEQSNLSEKEANEEKEANRQALLDEEARLAREQLLSEAKEQVRGLLIEAENQAKEQMQKCQAQVAALEEQARQEAFEVLEAAQQEATQIIEEANLAKKQVISETEPQIITLVQKLVGHIVHEEVTCNTRWIGLLVKKMLQQEMIKESVGLCMSPELYERLTEDEKQHIQSMGEGVRIKLDEHLTQTMCEIETSQGIISYDVNEGVEKVLHELDMLQRL